jgi:hypothetical protein
MIKNTAGRQKLSMMQSSVAQEKGRKYVLKVINKFFARSFRLKVPTKHSKCQRAVDSNRSSRKG